MRTHERRFPELGLFGSGAEAGAAWKRAKKQSVSWRLLAAVVLVFLVCHIVLVALFGWVTNEIWPRAFPEGLVSPGPLTFVLLPPSIVAMLVGHFGTDRRCRAVLRRILQEKGVPICITCGYDCRGLQEPRCPECGREFDRKLLQLPEIAADGAAAQVPPGNPQPATHNPQKQRTTDHGQLTCSNKIAGVGSPRKGPTPAKTREEETTRRLRVSPSYTSEGRRRFRPSQGMVASSSLAGSRAGNSGNERKPE